MPEADRTWHEPPELVDAIRERAVLLGVSYRLLGSVADAEDAVQETYIRWYRLSDDERRRVANPRAWLITTASRIGLDLLRSARARREHYVGEWLPEPLPSGTAWTSQDVPGLVDPADRVTQDESVSMALLVVLESMTPAERVAFVLHDAFGCTFAEIAEIVGRTPAACRQLASSARRRVRAERRAPVAAADHAAAVRSFRTAWEAGDLAGLIAVLDPDAMATTDGGGIVPAALEPIVGRSAVARFFVGIVERQPDLAVHETLVNGELGLLATGGDGRPLAVLALAATDGGAVERIWAIRNPRKLRLWRP